MHRADLTAFGLIFSLAAIISFTGLLCPLQEPQESRYAEIPRQMLREDSYLVPVLHGHAYYDKPPLLYWLVMGSYGLFGVSDVAARLVPCIAAFLTILIAYAWAWRLAGARAAFLGAAILCLSPRFIQLDRMLTPDSVFSLCVVAAWASGHIALQGNRLGVQWWIVSAIACGLGLLTKGPVALVLVLPPLFFVRWLDAPTARPGFKAMAAYLAVSVGVAVPWFVAVAARDQCFVYYFFWFHHVQRFVEPFDHAEPFWYYAPELFLGMLPWTLLLPGMMASLFRRTSAPPVLRVFLVAGLWCVAFFSLSGCKRAFYVLPAVPPLAMALGCYLDYILAIGHGREWSALWLERSYLGFTAKWIVILTSIGGAILGVACGIIGWRSGAAFGAGAVVAVAVAMGLGVRHRGRASWAVCGAAMSLLMLAGVSLFLPAYAEKFSLRGEVECQAATCSSERGPILCYPRRWDSVSFYLGRDDVRAFTEKELEILIEELANTSGAVVFARTGRESAILNRLPASRIWKPLGRAGQLTVGQVVARDQ